MTALRDIIMSAYQDACSDPGRRIQADLPGGAQVWIKNYLGRFHLSVVRPDRYATQAEWLDVVHNFAYYVGQPDALQWQGDGGEFITHAVLPTRLQVAMQILVRR